MNRLFTRSVLIGNFLFVGVASWHTLEWMHLLDPEKLSDVQYAAGVAAPAALLGALLKYAGEMYARYMETGRQIERDRAAQAMSGTDQ